MDSTFSFWNEKNAARDVSVSNGKRGFLGNVAAWVLRRRNHIGWNADGQLALTDVGRKRAESIVRAHRLWEAYLGKHFASHGYILCSIDENFFNSGGALHASLRKEKDACRAPAPLVLVVHGNHGMADYSDPGYAYLGERPGQ